MSSTACDRSSSSMALNIGGAATSPLVGVRVLDLGGVAPAVIGVGDYDPMLDMCIEYGKRLTDAGVTVKLHIFPELIHSFLGLDSVSANDAAATRMNSEFKAFLDTSGGTIRQEQRGGVRQ